MRALVLCLALAGCTRDTGSAETDGGSDTDGDTDPEPSGCEVRTWDAGLSPSARLHVSPGGDDASGDGSEGLPFATIGRAARDATPGTAIVVHEGTYAGGIYLEDLEGTASAPIWIGGAEGEGRPVIEGGSEALHITRAKYVIVHDLEARNTTSNGINADDGGDYADETASHHVGFRNLYVHDVGGDGNQDCLKLSGLNDWFVVESEISTCGGAGSGSAVDQVGCHRGLIAGNHLHDLSGNAVQAKGGTEDVEIRNNLVENAGERAFNLGGSTGFEYFRPPLSTTSPNAEARRIVVIGNVVVGSVAPIAYVGCVGCEVVNNTIVDPENWVIRILQETTTSGDYEFEPVRDGVFANNLVYYAVGELSTHVNVGPDTSPETFTFANDLWYAHDDPASSAPRDLPVAETGAIVGSDPAFVSGYAIDGSSPAAGAGMPWEGLGTAMTGACFADPPSIGAYEVP
jgi:hypothetical protein